MKVLVVGGGAREHSLCASIAADRRVERVYAAPGNAGTAEVGRNVPVAADDVSGIVGFAERAGIDLTVVGPEAPLVAGLADALEERGLAAFGPSRAAARIEGSKVWARGLCERHGIPAPRSAVFTDPGPAVAELDRFDPPYVVKADGLAAGKGVTVAQDRPAAERAIEDCLVRGAFGPAGSRVLVEEFLEGFEVSAMAVVDGTSVLPLALAHDYKRALDGDLGPNTGGMGAYSPVPAVGRDLERRILETVLRPAAGALAEEGVRYRGVLFAGLMVTADGPKVLEFNCRFGDPEAQAVLPRLRSSLPELLLAAVRGDLGRHAPTWTADACVGVVLASEGYPGPVRAGREISGLPGAAALPGVRVFHGGTAERAGRVVTAGGRVLTVTALGADLGEARGRAYEAVGRIRFDGARWRRDVAAEGILERVGRGAG